MRTRKEPRAEGSLGAALPAILFGIALTLSLAQPILAHAAALHRGGFEDVPPDTVSINHPLKLEDATFSTTDEDSFARIEATVWGLPATCIAYTQPTVKNEPIEGSFSLLWENAGIDDDGEGIDLRVTVSDILPNCEADSLALIDDGGPYLCLDAIRVDGGDAGVRMSVKVETLKHADEQPAAGNMLVSFVDVDVVKHPPLYSEQITLLQGFGEAVWVPESNFLDISEDATRFTAARIDQDTYNSGFVTTANTEEFQLEWQGDSCGTYFLMPFKADDQIISATATPGGTISDEGETPIRWKNDKTYTFAPDAGHVLKDVIVDGVSQGPLDSYTFERVTEGHTIQAVFEKLPEFTVRFLDGFGGVLETQKVVQGEAADPPEDPTRDGWGFTGWDRDFSQVTEDLDITAQWEALIAVAVPTSLACAIMADGSVVEPTDYAIRNLSPVAVALDSATTADMPRFGSYRLRNETGSVVHSFSGGSDLAGEQLVIEPDAAAALAWDVGDIRGGDAQGLLNEALKGPAYFCSVTFAFRQA